MLKLRDLYTQLTTAPIRADDATQVGQAILQYEVRRYTDTRNLTSTDSYLVTCTQRLIVPNGDPYAPSTSTIQSYANYPALVIANVAIDASDQQTILVDYFPRTLNTSVSTALDTASGSSTSLSQQYTSGSSTAQTNSFGTSSSIGFFGDAPTGGFSADSSTALTTEQAFSATSGTAIDTSSQLSNSTAMSVKDWGSYAQLDVGDTNLTWIWGQEYPWNVIQFNAANATQTGILLPDFIQRRLLDVSDPANPVLYPPSELSLFGVDFVSKATWLIKPQSASAGGDTISFTHAVTLGYGKHSNDSGALATSLNTVHATAIPSGSIDLALYALDPLSSSGPAIIGFVPDQFAVAPTSAGSAFAIASDANDLLVRGSGFNGIMTTDFSAGTASMTVYFKVLEPDSDISLSLKNWLDGSVPCMLTIVINNQQPPLYRYVDAPETSGGADNVTVVSLRYTNFTSVNYCDFLQMGLNEVSITITPTATTSPVTYQLLALAVG